MCSEVVNAWKSLAYCISYDLFISFIKDIIQGYVISLCLTVTEAQKRFFLIAHLIYFTVSLILALLR